MLAAASLAAALAWAPRPAANLERTEVAAARIGGSVYVAGGFVPGGASTNAAACAARAVGAVGRRRQRFVVGL